MDAGFLKAMHMQILSLTLIFQKASVESVLSKKISNFSYRSAITSSVSGVYSCISSRGNICNHIILLYDTLWSWNRQVKARVLLNEYKYIVDQEN